MLRLEHLQALDAVARLGSIAAAAESLNLTPSAVSQQLTKLARDVHADLHVAQGRGVRLTVAGQVLAGAADRILREVADAETQLGSLGETMIGPLRLGSIPSGVHSFVTEAMSSMSEHYPGVDMSVIEAEPERALPMVISGDIDLAVVESWDNMPLPRPPATRWIRLQDDSASLVIPIDAAPESGELDIASLRDFEWVGWTQDSRAHAWMIQTLRGFDIEPGIKHCVTGYSTQFALVARVGAAALVPTMSLAALPADLRERVHIAPLVPRLSRNLFAVTRQSVTRPVIDAFVEALAVATSAGHLHAQSVIDDDRYNAHP